MTTTPPATDGFWLGERVSPDTGDRTGEPVTLRPDRLTTHGVIVGMTGSGKTGLGVVLLEEAMLAGVPVLALDPKGDLGNLLLNFPGLSASEFGPWVDPAEARRKGRSVEEHAEVTAATWREGLASWGIDGERVRRLRDAARACVFTPGSTAGVPLDVVGSLACPPLDFDDHAETLRDEIEGFVSSLLAMADVDADPLADPEHILLSNLIEHAWRAGRDLTLEELVMRVPEPPFRKLGVFELDAFFPQRERRALAMRLNGLVASPSFAEWRTGFPLDVGRLLRTDDGGPRASILHLAHLSDAERQFVVTLVLSKLVTWMRAQAGTSDLRALVYFDEVYGFAPPTARPPSKKPLLTIFKQGRAHGVGLVAATQNPVDLDYKTMANAGTWMVGRLQTERDKARIVEALRSASGDVDVSTWDARIGGLGKRQFLLRSARSPDPTLFTSRWAMSYLRGALTRQELRELTQDAPERRVGDEAGARAGPTPERRADEAAAPPEVAEGVPVRWLDPAAPWAGRVGALPGGRRMEAAIAARVTLRYDDRYAEVDHTEEWEAIFHPLSETFRPEDRLEVDYDERDFREEPPADAGYVPPDPPVDSPGFWRSAEAELRDVLTAERSVEVLRNPELGAYSRVGESREDFEERCRELAAEEADAEAAKLRDRFERRIRSVERSVASAERRLRELEVDVQSRKQQEVVAGAGELLSLFLGGRRRTRSLSGVASRRSMTRRTEERKASTEEKLADEVARLEELEAELADELLAIAERWESAAEEIEPVSIGLEESDVRVERTMLVWIPKA